jgi:transposase
VAGEDCCEACELAGELATERTEHQQTLAEVSRLRTELAAARTDLLDVRGLLSPQGYPDVTPVPLVPAVAPAVAWLVDQLDALRAQVAEHEQRADQMREYARVLIRGTGEIPAVDVAWKLQQIVGPVALPLASDQEREHPGTGTRMEPVECAPDGTWHTLSILREESARDD